MADANPDAVLEVIGAPEGFDRHVVSGWLRELEIPAEAWWELTPLWLLLETVAAVRAAADYPELSRDDAIRVAAEDMLRLEDDGESATHPADRITRRLRRWRAAARAAAAGQSVRAPEDEAA